MTFLPKWKGFVKNTVECEAMLVTEAFDRIYAILECLENVYLFADNMGTCKCVNDLEFAKVSVQELVKGILLGGRGGGTFHVVMILILVVFISPG